jgi:uncharacterized membrane protein (UPF0127 family)
LPSAMKRPKFVVMATFIAQILPKLIKILVFFLIFLPVFGKSPLEKATLTPPLVRPSANAMLSLLRQGELILPSGKKLKIYLAGSTEEQKQGLSGLLKKDFSTSHGMLFLFREEGQRRFWMKDTNFNLDIIFLDQDLKVLDRENDMPAHPGYDLPENIPMTRTVWARHVLELRSDSPWSKEIKIGITLHWKGKEKLIP